MHKFSFQLVGYEILTSTHGDPVPEKTTGWHCGASSTQTMAVASEHLT
jgi:hypothetical protein